MSTDAQLIDAMKNKRHPGTNHRIVMKRNRSGEPCRAVEFVDCFGQRVHTLAGDLIAGEM